MYYSITTGTAGTSDITTRTGSLTIAQSRTTGTITVPVAGDATVEPNETFTVTLTPASGVVSAARPAPGPS